MRAWPHGRRAAGRRRECSRRFSSCTRFRCTFVAVVLVASRSLVFVGLVLGMLVAMALLGGAVFKQVTFYEPLPSPLEDGFIRYMACALVGGWIGGLCAWGIWLALAHAFLPKRVAVALIEWQRGMSDPTLDADREPRIAVTA